MEEALTSLKTALESDNLVLNDGKCCAEQRLSETLAKPEEGPRSKWPRSLWAWLSPS